VMPAVLERKVTVGDSIVMVSDGVSDAMQGENIGLWLNEALALDDEVRAANALVERAQSKLGRQHDDMTAIVLRIVQNKPGQGK
jgi:serine/threonine protein phosphatase PrpC